MADMKQNIMDQVRQQAALSNARLLVEVSLSSQCPSPSLSQTPSTNTIYFLDRNSTNTALSAASPNPAPRCLQEKRRAIRIAWRSTCRRGIRCRSSIWRRCRRASVAGREGWGYEDENTECCVDRARVGCIRRRKKCITGREGCLG